MKTKLFITFICVFLASFLFFMGILFVFTRENLMGADVPKTDVPYDANFIPNNTTLLLTFPDNYGAVIEFKFKEKFINALILKDATKESVKEYGFFVDHTAECDYSFMMDFIDKIDGIDLALDGKSYRYTGVQICNLVASFKDDTPLRAKILEGVFNKISNSGLRTEALYCIIEDTNTTLSVPSCYGWCEYMKETCSSFNILNER
jgi:hypothetical protein